MGWGDTLGDVYNSASSAVKEATDKAAEKAESAYNYAQDKADQAEGIYKDAEQKKAEAEKAYADAKKRAEEAEAEYEKRKEQAEEAAEAAKAAYEWAKNNPEAAAAEAAQKGMDAAQQQSEQAAEAIEQAEAAKEAFDDAADEVGASSFAKKVAKAAADAVQDIVGTTQKGVDALIDQAIETAKDAYKAIEDWFSGDKGGGTPVQPCPNAPKPPQPAPPKPGPPPPPPPPPPEDDINIVSVDWLDGNDTTIISAPTQWVNLPRDAKWLADSGIPNIDRLGTRPRFIVKFDKPKSAGFQWRIIEVAGGTPPYTGTEQGRNSNFIASSRTWTSGSASNGQAIMANAAQVVAGGGYKFQIEAKDDKGKVVKSGILTTQRLFWIVELPMTGLKNVLSSTASFEAEFAKHFITLKPLPDLSIPLQENIGSKADSDLLAKNVKDAINADAKAKAKAPYLIRITYTDHLAVKNPNQRLRRVGVKVGPGEKNIVMGVDAPGLLTPNTVERRALWHNLVTGEGWFVSAWYTPAGSTTPIEMPKGTVSAASAGDRKRRIQVIVSGLPAGTATIDVYVNVVDRMRAGLAFGGAADICICTMAWWTAQSEDEQAQVVVHELGHKIQMVAAGRAKEPDRVSTQYDNSGHVGSHCFKGCTAGQADYSTSENEAASQCVMFGSTNGQIAFCGNCAPAVKKVDIGAGF